MFNKKAEALELDDNYDEEQPLVARSRKGLKHSKKHERLHDCSSGEYMDLNSFGSFPAGKYKKRTLKQLTVDHRIEILHSYLIEFKF